MERNSFDRLFPTRGLSNNNIDNPEVPDYIMPDSEIDRVIREIFTVNEKTGLPEGDIAYFLSSNGNPKVKEWLTNNLLKPRSVASGSSVEGVTDDLIAECMPLSGEDKFAYASRLANIRDEAIKNLESKK